MEDFLKSETRSILDFLNKHWNVPSGARLSEVVETAFMAGYKKGSPRTGNRISSLTVKSDVRSAFLDLYMPALKEKDQILGDLRAISRADIHIQGLVLKDWDFFTYFSEIHKQIIEDIGLIEVYPVLYGEVSDMSYIEAVREHVDFDDYGYFDKNENVMSVCTGEQKSFTGLKIRQDGFSEFIERISMHSVLHRNSNGDEETPFYQLISELITHGLKFGEYCNTRDIGKELDSIDLFSCSLRTPFETDNKYLSVSLSSFRGMFEENVATDEDELFANSIILPGSREEIMEKVNKQVLENFNKGLELMSKHGLRS